MMVLRPYSERRTAPLSSLPTDQNDIQELNLHHTDRVQLVWAPRDLPLLPDLHFHDSCKSTIWDVSSATGTGQFATLSEESVSFGLSSSEEKSSSVSNLKVMEV